MEAVQTEPHSEVARGPHQWAARASADGPPVPPPDVATAPAAGAEDLAEARAGGGIAGRIEPEILTGDALAAVLALPGPALVSWCEHSEVARAVLSARELAQVALLARRALDLRDRAAVRARRSRDGWTAISDAIHNAARFAREALVLGDHHLRRQRLAIDAARLAAGTEPDDGVDARLDEILARRRVVLDGTAYTVMAVARGARAAQLYSRHRPSTLHPVPGTQLWRHTTGSRGSSRQRHRWYRLDGDQFTPQPR